MNSYGTSGSDRENTRLLDPEQAAKSAAEHFEYEAPVLNDFNGKFVWLLKKLKSWQGISVSVIAVIFLLMIYTVNGGFGSITIIQSNVPTYTVYLLRHAEAKFSKIYKCDPVQDPMLPDSIGYCGDSWGNNRCGGDYLTNEGLERARCIAGVDFPGLTEIHAQFPGTCFDEVVKREYQTALPLSLKYDIPIDSSLGRGDEWEMANKLTNSDMRKKLCGSDSFTLGRATLVGNMVTEEEGKESASWFGGSHSSTNSKSDSKSVVVIWDHSMMPDLLKYMGCSTDSRCVNPLGLLEFDIYYRIVYSCADSTLLDLKELQEGCSPAFSTVDTKGKSS